MQQALAGGGASDEVSPLPLVHIAMGANLGHRRRTLAEALWALKDLATPPGAVQVSSLWESEPIGFAEPVEPFYNAVARLRYSGTPEALLAQLQALEARHGRQRQPGASPASGSASAEGSSHSGSARAEGAQPSSRELDLDIIDFGGVQQQDAKLRLPHPRAQQRLFVLLPLQEVTPDFLFPASATPLSQLIKAAPPMRLTCLRPWA